MGTIKQRLTCTYAFFQLKKMLRKSLLFGTAALAAPIAYFQMLCYQEKEHFKGSTKKFNDVFDPDQTNAADVPMMFACKGTKNCIDLRFQKGQYEGKNSMPCAIEKFWKFVQNPTKTHEEKKVTFLDARKNYPGDFHDSGFTLIQLESEPETKDWRTPVGTGKEADIEKFHKQMEPYLKKLYPDVKRIVWTYNVIRDANPNRAPTDQPTANGPHLDYHQNDSLRKEFHAEKPVMVPDNEYASRVESSILMGSLDTEESKLGVLLGVWKPIFPEKICDHPLAIMDARTFKEEYQTANELSFGFGQIDLNILGGGIAHEPDQKWYYYPFQSTKEVLVFHQYSKDRFFANPHTSFFNKNCPQDTKNRMSVEFRVALFF